MWDHEHKWKYLRKGGLRMWVLSILQQSPRNGAEIMDQIEIATQGWWRPSPGSVYPLLDELQKEGNVKKRDDGRYEITEKGKQEFEWPWGMPKKQSHTVDEVIAEINGYVSYLEDLAKSDNSKLAPFSQKIKELQARLSKLGTD
ncbi:MAG: PadR family transcriptional regulator [Candidatus Bathyarchaeia archaeon]|jgi:DNA-binding PadR family transcriptional regulator